MTRLMKLSWVWPPVGQRQCVRPLVHCRFSTTTLKLERAPLGTIALVNPSAFTVQLFSVSGTPLPLAGRRPSVIARAAVSSGPPVAPLSGACLNVMPTVTTSPTLGFGSDVVAETCTQLLGSGH